MLNLRPSIGVVLALTSFAVSACRVETVRADASESAAERLLSAANEPAQHSGYGSTRAWLRNKIVSSSDLEKYGLHLDNDWSRADSTRPVVIFIHGFNSTPKQNAALLTPLHDAGFPCGTFAYPNDYTIRYASQLLSSELRRFHQHYPDRRVALVCHSMGGLVARACIEDSLYDPGNIDRLVMIAPPTHGTVLAHFAVGTDVWEHWLSRKEGWPWQRMRDSIVDGLGEAACDLCPQSEFLTELDSRPLNPRIRYTVLLGTGAQLSEAQLDWIRDSVCRAVAKMPGGSLTAVDIKKFLDDVDELVDGKGDGVVAVKRGRLNGVSDTVIMPFGHLAVTGAATNDLIRDVQHAVLVRVQ